MSNQKPPYAIVVRKPACGCIVLISTYWPDNPRLLDPDLPKEIADCIRAGLLINTVPFDQNPLSNGADFGCKHQTGQLTLAME